MDRGAWWATVQGVAKSQTQLSTALAYDLDRTLKKIFKNILMEGKQIPMKMKFN